MRPLQHRAGYGRKVHLRFFIQTLQKEDERAVERGGRVKMPIILGRNFW